MEVLPSFAVFRDLFPAYPCIECYHHHLLFFVLIISLLSLLYGFPFCTEQNIYQNIALFKILWNYLSNVLSFIKNGVQTRELCPFYFSDACCPKLISGRIALGDSVITACRNLLLSWFLICWNRNFMGSKYPKIFNAFPSRPCRILMR
jgi:hypothetical protein